MSDVDFVQAVLHHLEKLDSACLDLIDAYKGKPRDLTRKREKFRRVNTCIAELVKHDLLRLDDLAGQCLRSPPGEWGICFRAELTERAVPDAEQLHRHVRRRHPSLLNLANLLRGKDNGAPVENVREGEHAEGVNTDNGHGKCAEPVPADEANQMVRNYIAQKEKIGERCTARDVASHCGIALGRVSDLPAWQAYQARKKSGNPSRTPKRPRQLTGEMLARIGKEDDPSARLASAEENAWRHLLESATPEERARLNAMTPAEKAEAIQLTIDQIADQSE